MMTIVNMHLRLTKVLMQNDYKETEAIAAKPEAKFRRMCINMNVFANGWIYHIYLVSSIRRDQESVESHKTCRMNISVKVV